MIENYYALAISIIKGLHPEQSFELLETGRVKQKCNPEDLDDILKLQAMGMSYEELGEAYGISEFAAYARVKRAKGRMQ